VQRVPGVESAAIDCSAPLSGISLRYPFLVEGRPRNAGSPDEAVFHATSADFFRTLRIPLAQGRALDARDHERSTKVCVISQALARQLFPDENPIGRRIQVLPWILREYREIVGVVGDVRQDNLADNPPPQIYVPQSQSPWFFSTLLVRTDGRSVSPAALQAALRRADPTASFNLGSLDRSIAATTTVPRLRAILFGVFGAIALGLSVFGIHASMAFSVRQRVREIGVRMAMGAGPGDVLREVLLRTARLAAAGVGIGLLGATALMQALRGTLHAVQPVDPWTLAALALLLPLAALAASLLPAIAAARLHPTAALQHE
jgi:predicted permease